MPKTICIYHGNCADGFTAAWVLMRWSDECAGQTEYIPGVYGEEPPDVTGADVFLVDFSYKRDVLERMAQEARTITILDHHKTAEADLSGLEKYPNIDITFDTERSGAQLAWDYCKSRVRPVLVDYVADRDLWLFEMDGSREVSAVIYSHEYSFDVWDVLYVRMQANANIGRMIREGEAILRKHDKDIRELLAVTRREMVIGGHRVPVANLPYTMASDAAGSMATTAPFAGCYFDKPDARVFSLRSCGNGAIDVSEIAARYGGGGHRNAAEFQMPLGWEGDAV